ncbi:hypothetical protein WH52_06685 [Tenacibaculum holothuriorum]|uniref:Uncharacterized protein n=1 Tax=Tenacibaculum holothuriorum TaxID=1635173 RepID=A0A1Y2PD75_9FLAO|nr:hypothetical protein [Tenacibaculum holothuriorum]OSY88436.1 hypothetical protein WH52_06685 [Tenacibaculum holothuriorum]
MNETEKWKVKFLEKKKQDKKKYLIRVTFGFSIIMLVLLFTYFSFKSSFQFFGKETKIVKGKVDKSSLYHIGQGLYRQKVYIKYKIKEADYSIYYTLPTILKVYSPQDSSFYNDVFIEYEVSDPNNSRVIINN